jgi:hypothetical protein
MKLEPRIVVAPLAAIAILATILTETREALHLSGAWRTVRAAHAAAPDPFAPLDQALAREVPATQLIARDPFGAAIVVAVASPRRKPVPRVAVPKPVLQPQLTSIIFDADPRATLRWDGHDYSVRAGALFADFRVVSISRDQVILDRGGEPVVLALPKKGE